MQYPNWQSLISQVMPYWKRSISGGIAIIIVSLLTRQEGEIHLRQLPITSIILYGVLSCVALLYYSPLISYTEKRLRITAGLLAFVFSQFIAVGINFQITQDIAGCFSGALSTAIWALQSVTFSIMLYYIILGIIISISNLKATERNARLNWGKCFLALLAIRICYLIAFYPCVFGFDAAVGLRTFLDPNSATCSHHPFFIQLIHGAAFQIGVSLGHKTIGFAGLSLLLVVTSCQIIIYGLQLLAKANVSHRWLLILTIVYVTVPIFPYLSVYPTKDGIFAYTFLLYIETIYHLFLTQGKCMKNGRFLSLHIAASLLLCLTRHQGFIFYLIETTTLLYAFRHLWKNVLIGTLPVLILYFAFTKAVTPYFNVEPAGKQETYGPLFQQTAYYLKKNPKDITSQERSAIDAILNSESIASLYEFNKTDAVKNTYKYNPWYRETVGSPSMFRHIVRTNEKKEITQYLLAWTTMFLRHPFTYFQASSSVFWGFFYNIGQPLILTEPRWGENNNATTPNYSFWHVNKFAFWAQKNMKAITQCPIINWVGAIPYYNWFALLLLAILFCRKDRDGIIVFLPVILSFGILLICPVAFGRYIFPIVITLPLLFAYIISKNSKKCQE